MKYIATWPILDRAPLADLVAEAEADLPDIVPLGIWVTDRNWTIDHGTLILTATAEDVGTCSKGLHTMTPANTQNHPRERRCRTCRNAAERERKKARKAARVMIPAEARYHTGDRWFPVAPLLPLVRPDVLNRADEKMLERAKDRGEIAEAAADRIACAAGLHPALVWPEWFEYEEAS